MRFPLIGLFALCSLALFSACGDDVVDGEGSCPPGESLNPITGQCTPDQGGATNQGGGTDNQGGGTDNQGGGTDNQGGGTNNQGGEQPCGDGRIEGLACTPDGATLPVANVTISGTDCEGNAFSFETTTDNAGYYTFEDVPAGNQELVVTSGSFSGTRIVQVHPDQTTDLRDEAQKVCVAGDSAQIAVISGEYDNVGSLLSSMNIEYDIVGSDGFVDFGNLFGGGDGTDDAAAFLMDYSAMAPYQIIFIECGGLYSMLDAGGFDLGDFDLGGFFPGMGSDADMDVIIENLQTFVQNGGSLYSSDLAYQFMDDAFPDAATFLGTSGHSQDVTADVISNEMLSLLGTNQASISFNMGGWAMMSDAGANTTIHFQGDALHGAAESPQTASDIPFLISYDPPTGSGKAIYTSFHNSAQGALGGDMEEILRFLIFQL